jgi:hypothetical protein
VHPMVYSGAALLAIASSVTFFAAGSLCGAAMRAYEDNLYAVDDEAWSHLRLRCATLAVNCITAFLVLVLVRSHRATCVVKPQLGGTIVAAMCGALACMCYLAMFVSRAMGTTEDDVSEVLATISMAAFTLLMLVWNVICMTVCHASPDDVRVACEAEEEALGGDGGQQLSPDCAPDAALAAAQEAAHEVLASLLPPGSTLPACGTTCLQELTRRWPLILVGAALLTFAAVMSAFSLLRAMPAVIALTCSWHGDAACAAVFTHMTDDLGGSEVADGVTSLLLNAATLALGTAVLRSEIHGCAVKATPGMRAAQLTGAASALAVLLYTASMRLDDDTFSFHRGAGELAETAGTIAYALMLSCWNAVRFVVIPAAEEDKEVPETEGCKSNEADMQLHIDVWEAPPVEIVQCDSVPAE